MEGKGISCAKILEHCVVHSAERGVLCALVNQSVPLIIFNCIRFWRTRVVGQRVRARVSAGAHWLCRTLPSDMSGTLGIAHQCWQTTQTLICAHTDWLGTGRLTRTATGTNTVIETAHVGSDRAVNWRHSYPLPRLTSVLLVKLWLTHLHRPVLSVFLSLVVTDTPTPTCTLSQSFSLSLSLPLPLSRHDIFASKLRYNYV